MRKKRSIELNPGVVGMFLMSAFILIAGLFLNLIGFIVAGAICLVASIIWGIIENLNINKNK